MDFLKSKYEKCRVEKVSDSGAVKMKSMLSTAYCMIVDEG